VSAALKMPMMLIKQDFNFVGSDYGKMFKLINTLTKSTICHFDIKQNKIGKLYFQAGFDFDKIESVICFLRDAIKSGDLINV
jgi:hypothetical protein